MILKVEKLEKWIKNNNILLDINFSIKEGEWIGIIGNNGSGKTTLLEILSGIRKQSSGTYEYDEILNDEHGKKNISMQFQQTSFPYALTVKDMIKLAIHSRKAKYDEEKVIQVLEALDIKDVYKKRANRLSGGQKQKVNFIMSIIHKPKLIFLDEFTSALDLDTKNTITNLILQIKEHEKVSGIVISHDPDEIEKICDRVIILEDGKMIMDLNMKSILEKYKSVKNLYIKKVSKGVKDESYSKLY